MKKTDITDFNKALDEPTWPPELEINRHYTRTHDDHDGTWTGKISVFFTPDGDAYLFTDNQPPLRFRTELGGTNSPHINQAMRLLAEAIRLDNLELPEPKPETLPPEKFEVGQIVYTPERNYHDGPLQGQYCVLASAVNAIVYDIYGKQAFISLGRIGKMATVENVYSDMISATARARALQQEGEKDN